MRMINNNKRINEVTVSTLGPTEKAAILFLL